MILGRKGGGSASAGSGGSPTGAAGGGLSGTYPNPGFAVDMATQAELDTHVNDVTAAHAATAVAFTPAGTIAATDVQTAIEEAAGEAAGLPAWWTVDSTPDAETVEFAGTVTVNPPDGALNGLVIDGNGIAGPIIRAEKGDGGLFYSQDGEFTLADLTTGDGLFLIGPTGAVALTPSADVVGLAVTQLDDATALALNVSGRTNLFGGAAEEAGVPTLLVGAASDQNDAAIVEVQDKNSATVFLIAATGAVAINPAVDVNALDVLAPAGYTSSLLRLSNDDGQVFNVGPAGELLVSPSADARPLRLEPFIGGVQDYIEIDDSIDGTPALLVGPTGDADVNYLLFDGKTVTDSLVVKGLSPPASLLDSQFGISYDDDDAAPGIVVTAKTADGSAATAFIPATPA